MFTGPGGLVVNGNRICLYRSLEYEIPYGDICTFEVENGKMIIHDLGVEDVPAFGDFEADIKLEGKELTLTSGSASLTLEKN